MSDSPLLDEAGARGKSAGSRSAPPCFSRAGVVFQIDLLIFRAIRFNAYDIFETHHFFAPVSGPLSLPQLLPTVKAPLKGPTLTAACEPWQWIRDPKP